MFISSFSICMSTNTYSRCNMDPKECVRPTASNRNSRSKDAPSSSQNVVEDPQEEEVVVEKVEEDSYTDEAGLKGPFQGESANNNLLVDYRHHVAYRT
ncbi:hypothetical protein QJS04_geneDACA013338 [Acorus gramineus]|uniref:Uncharacterized protein n=1 Tax=Acorus gramineus TaxID=55184 RepID=A0AAV9A9Q7_ACOGR|nr:hypothetical protein QJS04_geneDACA013338 [Acorus gramineus]